jgi:hypothetical protein
MTLALQAASDGAADRMRLPPGQAGKIRKTGAFRAPQQANQLIEFGQAPLA